jgi:drug/metabolite transporter (DMT)-like permease
VSKAPSGAEVKRPWHDPQQRRRLAQLLLLVLPALWSTNYLVARWSPGVAHPHGLAAGRWLLVVLLLLPVVGATLWTHRAAVRREAGRSLVLGFCGMFVCGAWVYQAGKTTTALNMALIYAIAPVLIAVISVKLLHERMSASQRLGVLLSLLGLVFVVAKGDWRNLAQVRLSPGDVWIAAAAVAWTAYSLLLRAWPTALPPLARLATIAAGGTMLLLPVAVWELWALPPVRWGVPALGLVVVAAVVPGVLSYGAHAYLQRELGAARTALMQYLSPLYGALMGWLVLGERPGWYHAVGAALILPSVWLATRDAPVTAGRVNVTGAQGPACTEGAGPQKT